MNRTAGRQAGGSRVQLIALVAVFLAPLLAAVLVYTNAGEWLGQTASGHHGQLFQPARSLDRFPVRGTGGESLGLDYFRGKWTLVYFGSGDCPQRCRQALYRIRQAHKAQGRNIGRVQRLFVALGGGPDETTESFLRREHPHLKVAAPLDGARDFASFRRSQEDSPRGIYLVDPNANIVLRYGASAGAEGILEDLEHLLKHSAIG